MNKVLFFFCNLIAVIGICILFTTNILNKVFPMLGRTAFQASMAGSYSPDEYIINFTVINILAVLMIIGAVFIGYKIYRQDLK